ncbi:hypothetical protein MRX96_056851 [Rhipicephalus microplus]
MPRTPRDSSAKGGAVATVMAAPRQVPTRLCATAPEHIGKKAEETTATAVNLLSEQVNINDLARCVHRQSARVGTRE